MNTTEDLFQCKVAIVGLGLMGGSLAMALRGKCAALLGIDTDAAVIDLALRRQIIDQGSCLPEEILPAADLVVLAAPVEEILLLLGRLPQLHPGGPVIIDLGSSKRQIMQALAELPARFDPVGGHPMCGKEKSGLANAEPGIFAVATFALTRLPRTSPRAAALAEQMAQTVGATPLWMDAATHDRWAAATSHLPYLLACALAQATPAEARPLVGPGFRSTTRVAGTSPRVMLDIFTTNADMILSALSGFRTQLDRLESLVRSQDWPGLQAELEQAAESQKRFSEKAKRGDTVV